MSALPRRIVVTGLGAVTPLGTGVENFWKALLDGECGVGPITVFDPGDYPTRIAAEVKGFDNSEFFDRKDARFMARGTQFGVAAALMAAKHANWQNAPGDGKTAVVNGVSNSAQDAVEAGVHTLLEHGYRRLMPYVLTKSFPHSTASEAGRLTGFQSQVLTMSTGCTSGFNGIGYACREIVAERADAFLCIATDSCLAKHVFGGFCRSGMLSTNNDDPHHASRPFDAKRDGGILGEGAAAFFLEERDHARRRGAPALAEILGFATGGAGYRVGEAGAVQDSMATVMRDAMISANCAPESIDYLGCHGVSDPTLDAYETVAIKQAFGPRATRLPMSSIKGAIGIPQNAAGALQLVAAIQALNTGILPQTLNLEFPDPACDLDYIPGKPRRNAITRAMVFTHGFNGSDAALIIAQGDRSP